MDVSCCTVRSTVASRAARPRRRSSEISRRENTDIVRRTSLHTLNKHAAYCSAGVFTRLAATLLSNVHHISLLEIVCQTSPYVFLTGFKTPVASIFFCGSWGRMIGGARSDDVKTGYIWIYSRPNHTVDRTHVGPIGLLNKKRSYRYEGRSYCIPRMV